MRQTKMSWSLADDGIGALVFTTAISSGFEKELPVAGVIPDENDPEGRSTPSLMVNFSRLSKILLADTAVAPCGR